jgi:hypothetical protein
MPVVCPICGGGHPKWECKRQNLVRVPLPEFPGGPPIPIATDEEFAAAKAAMIWRLSPGGEAEAEATYAAYDAVPKTPVQDLPRPKPKPKPKHRLIKAAEEAAAIAKDPPLITTTRTPEELAEALGLPPAETVALWKARLDAQKAYMREYMKKYRARKKAP